MFVYDLRFHGQSGYAGHTMVILEIIAGSPKKYKVAEGHTSATPGAGTQIETKTYTLAEIKTKFPNSTAGDAGPPGLRDYTKKDAQGNKTWPISEEGGRKWNWSQFDKAKRCDCGK
jgi:hypothetical protein